MRIIHVSDTHLGFSAFSKVDEASGLNLREMDFYNAFVSSSIWRSRLSQTSSCIPVTFSIPSGLPTARCRWRWSSFCGSRSLGFQWSSS